MDKLFKMDSQVFYENLSKTQEGREYLRIIDKVKTCRRGLQREKGYEIHHIFTKALGGTSESDNLIKLTVFEHMLVHYYLALAIPCRQTLYPIIILSNRAVRSLSDLQKTQIETLKYWSKLREDANRALLGRVCINNGISKKYVFDDELQRYLNEGWNRGNLSTTRGRVTVNNRVSDRKIDPEDLQKFLQSGWNRGSVLKGKSTERKGKYIGQRKFVNNGKIELQVLIEDLEKYLKEGFQLGRKPFSEQTRQVMSEKSRGRKFSKEECDRRRRTGMGRTWCHLGEQTRWVTQTELNGLLEQGWKIGRKEVVSRTREVTPKSRKPVSEETRKKQSLARRGKKKSDITIEKMKTWRWVKDNAGNQLRIQMSELQNYLDKGWTEGRYSTTTENLKCIYWPETGKKRYVHEESVPEYLEKGWEKGHLATNIRKENRTI